jgi:hypothetical protein
VHIRAHITYSFGLPVSLLSFGLLVLCLSLTPTVVYCFYFLFFFGKLKETRPDKPLAAPKSQAQWQRMARRTFPCTLVGLNPKPFRGVKSPKTLYIN